MNEPLDTPANPLERALSRAKREPEAMGAFFGELLAAQVFVLAAEDTAPEAGLDGSGNLLVLTNASGKSVLPVFTTREKATPWHEREPRFRYGLRMAAAALVDGIGNDTGLVVNPGDALGVEIPAEVVVALRQHASRTQATP